MGVIPHIMHTIWVGGTPVSQKHQELISIKKSLLPSWEHRLWTDNEVSSLKLINQKWYDDSTIGAQKADILRLELLYLFGGVYADIDIHLLRPIDELIEGEEFFVAGQSTVESASCNNSVLGCSPRNEFIKMLIDEIPAAMQRSRQVSYQSGPHFITQMVRHNMDKHNIRIFGKEVFQACGYASFKTFKTMKEFFKRYPNAYSVHCSDKSWVKLDQMRQVS